MDRTTFGRKTCIAQRNCVDRFVAPRASFSDPRRLLSWHASSDTQQTNDIWFGKKEQLKKNYAKYLVNALGVESPDKNNSIKSIIQPWPCNPRKKSYLSLTNTYLDVPSYADSISPDVVDWSKGNLLVGTSGCQYVTMNWKDLPRYAGRGRTVYKIQCCKFDPTGELLLFGTYMNTVEVHTNFNREPVERKTNTCNCADTDRSCSITAVAWSPTGNSFAAGCSLGVITSFTRDAKVISFRRVRKKWIQQIRVSPNARCYLAVTVARTRSVQLLTWPSLEIYSKIDLGWKIKSICWHPWRTALLGVGAVGNDLQSHITLWDAPPCKVRKSSVGPKGYVLDTMIFSDSTGEMVLSMWNSTRSRLFVLSDLETVVDQCGESEIELAHVRGMIFSPNGTKLATGTANEEVVIWNFLPENYKMEKTKSESFSAFPQYLDEATQGFSLR